jgi:hypothetical protein
MVVHGRRTGPSPTYLAQGGIVLVDHGRLPHPNEINESGLGEAAVGLRPRTFEDFLFFLSFQERRYTSCILVRCLVVMLKKAQGHGSGLLTTHKVAILSCLTDSQVALTTEVKAEDKCSKITVNRPNYFGDLW